MTHLNDMALSWNDPATLVLAACVGIPVVGALAQTLYEMWKRK